MRLTCISTAISASASRDDLVVFQPVAVVLGFVHILDELLNVLPATGMPDASAPEAVAFEGLEHQRQAAVLLPRRYFL